MKALVISGICLLLAGCGSGGRRAKLTPGGRLPLGRMLPAASDEDEEREAEDGGRESLEYALVRRTGGAPLSMDKVMAAKRHAENMAQYSVAGRRYVARRAAGAPREADLGGWQALGPGNIGGRTRGFAIRPDNPAVMFAGAVAGGIWKTTDAGAHWTPLTDLWPTLSISSLAIDPKQPDTIYAGTGERQSSPLYGDSIRGAGIFKTTDGGSTWSQLPKPANESDFDYIYKVVVSPNDSAHIYAATLNGIYFSPDGGSTWKLQLDRGVKLRGCQDLVIRTDTPKDYLFAACGDLFAASAAIYRNTDAAGAGEWEVVFTAEHMADTSLAIAPSNQSIVYAAVATSDRNSEFYDGLLGIFRSAGSGDPGSWTMQTSANDPNRLNQSLFSHSLFFFYDVCTGRPAVIESQATWNNTLAVDPADADIVWLGATNIFRSDDGGKNWGIAGFDGAGPPWAVHDDFHVLSFAPGYNGVSNQTLFAATDGGIYRTDNARATVATGPRAACPPFKSTVAWTNLNNGYAVTQFYHGSVFPGAAAYLAGAQDNGIVLGSDAGGDHWEMRSVGDGGYTAIDPTDTNVWYLEDRYLQNLEKTFDGGRTFTRAMNGINEAASNFPFIPALVMDPSEHQRLYVGGKTLWRTNNGAAKWSAASAPLPATAGAIQSIAVHPTDPNRVVFGTSKGFVYRSTKALTASQSSIWASSLPRSGFISHVAFDPADPNVVYVTFSQYKVSDSDQHVYKSLDGGATWIGIDGEGAAGLPDIPVFSIIADPERPATLYLATDIGVFVSPDGGATWARDDNPFANTVTENLVLDRSAGQTALVAFTHGRGVWKTILPGSGEPCRYSVSEDSFSFPAFGGTASLKVTTGERCAWSAVPSTRLVTVGSPGGGIGTKSITISAQPNISPEPLTSQVWIQDHAVNVTQAGAQVASGNDDLATPFRFGSLPNMLIQDTNSATESKSDPVHSCTRSADSKTLWYLITANDTGTLHLGFFNLQANGGDAGTVLSLYRPGSANPEFGCFVVPQTTGDPHDNDVSWWVNQGEFFIVEVSATTFGAASGASLTGGNLVMMAVITK